MIQPIGHFRVWRSLYSKPIWLNSTLEQQVILTTLMAMANFKANQWEWEGQKYELKPGQFITSSKSIIENTGGNVTIQNVRTALKRFEKLEFLTNVSTKRGRLITLVNWQDYQYVENEGNQASNQGLTEGQPTPNQDLTTIEEGKKVDNEKKVYGEFVLLTDKEYKDLLDRLTNTQRIEYIERLNNYIGSTGTKYKSHYHTVLAWYRKDNPIKKDTSLIEDENYFTNGR